MTTSGITCPACGVHMALHHDGGCPTDSFEMALAEVEADDNDGLRSGELAGAFIELLTLRQLERIGDPELDDVLVERLCEFSDTDLAVLLRCALGVVLVSMDRVAEDREGTVEEVIQQAGLALAQQATA